MGMSNKVADLTPILKSKYEMFLKQCGEKGISILLLNTLRSKAQQLENIKKGVSWTMNSKHLPGPDGLSRAFDIVPYKLSENGKVKTLIWNAGDPVWQELGKIGKGLGLTWGGDWKQKDMGHFQL